MASYVNPELREKFESLSIDLKNDILKRDVQLNTIYDLIQILEVISEGRWDFISSAFYLNSDYGHFSKTHQMWKILFFKQIHDENYYFFLSQWFTLCLKPDFCRKISIKYPSNQINTRSGGFVILSDFHGVLALELGVWKIFFAIGYCTIIPSSCSYHIC